MGETIRIITLKKYSFDKSGKEKKFINTNNMSSNLNIYNFKKEKKTNNIIYLKYIKLFSNFFDWVSVESTQSQI